jgi:hypothetical protein
MNKEKRLREMANVLGEFMENNPLAEEGTVPYDGTVCDGACMAEDCQIIMNEAADEIERLRAELDLIGGATQSPTQINNCDETSTPK